jgi:hypothetical protein
MQFFKNYSLRIEMRKRTTEKETNKKQRKSLKRNKENFVFLFY